MPARQPRRKANSGPKNCPSTPTHRSAPYPQLTLGTASQAGPGPALRRPGHAVLQHRVFCRLLLPALGQPYARFARAQTLTDQAVLACALERYRLARGQFPEQLQALAPAYLERGPADVISGEPMRYRRTPDGGFTLWSVGWHGADEGGVPAAKADELRHADWVWEVGRAVPSPPSAAR